MSTLTTVLRYARQRERALTAYGRLTPRRAKAISTIKRKADFFRSVPESKQKNIVNQLFTELQLLLPGPNSRYSKMREEILQLMAESRSIGTDQLTSNHKQ